MGWREGSPPEPPYRETDHEEEPGAHSSQTVGNVKSTKHSDEVTPGDMIVRPALEFVCKEAAGQAGDGRRRSCCGDTVTCLKAEGVMQRVREKRAGGHGYSHGQR